MKKIFFFLLFFIAFQVNAQVRVSCFNGDVSVDSLWTQVETSHNVCTFRVAQQRDYTLLASIRKHPSVEPNRLVLLGRALEGAQARTPVIGTIANVRFGTETRPHFVEQYGFFRFMSLVNGEIVSPIYIYKHISALSKVGETEAQYYFEFTVLGNVSDAQSTNAYNRYESQLNNFKNSLQFRPRLVVNPGVMTGPAGSSIRDAARPALPSGVKVPNRTKRF
ncbi:MAG: hypothetical protein JNN12_05105 [Bacteroidetes Order II. Incertae sedis bacterium]|nr:hypothetical protein [Bacteroidetes Order II. bacterium]